jgi:hypothetical protein
MDVTYLQANRAATMTLPTTGPNAGKIPTPAARTTSTGELYDPATNTTSPTGEMAIAR